MTDNVENTINLMKTLHHGQTDQSGRPYFFHPIRVSQNVIRLYPDAHEDIILAALLHDTIEDCDIDEAFLESKGYSENCIEMISLVTKDKGGRRSYTQVIDYLILSNNRGAILIKIADNMDNLHPLRVKELMLTSPDKAKRLGDRYRKSIDKLCIAADINSERVYMLIEDYSDLEK
ncbi:MAG: HD domain-containing protein [Alphaproteobacteria bacterium]